MEQGYVSSDPSQRWKQAADSYAKSCKGIMGLSESIRYVGALNRYGRTVAGFIKPGAEPMMSREQAKNDFFILSAMLNLHIETESAIGKLKDILIHHEKVKMVIIPSGKIAYLVTINGDEEQYMQIIEDIKSYLNPDS